MTQGIAFFFRRAAMALVLAVFPVWGLPVLGLPLAVRESGLLAEEANAEDLKFFEQRIRPLLIEHCHECHDADAAESDLQLDSWEGIARGGKRGPAVVPGQPDESWLIRAVRHGELLKMPPKRKLSTAEVAYLEQWVARGSVWPGATKAESPRAVAGAPAGFSDSQLKHWAFQAPRVSAPPPVRGVEWPQSPVDNFILAGLEAQGLSPAAPASPATLVRRVTFDLTGLPPTPEEVDAFVADRAPDAFARLVDRLLHSPRYGERWGRHWLDVARYADSNGLDENLAYARAFRYRDYVIQAFNSDKPYDRFVIEQVAGDLLPGSDGTDLEAVVATGFLSIGAKMLAEDDPVKMQMDIVDEQIDTLGRAFLGMTWGCARCHDHKFDPITARDYYALAGIFKSTQTMETHTVVARWLERPLALEEEIKRRDEAQAKVAEIEKQIDASVKDSTSRLLEAARKRAGDYMLAAYTAERLDAWRANAKSVGNSIGSSPPPGVLLIETENYLRGNVLRELTGYGHGIGVLVNKGELPNFAEYEVLVPEDGFYQFEMRYAAAASRPTLLAINGEACKSDAASGITGSWHPDGQRWFVEGVFPLRAGTNVIRLEQPHCFPHIDKLLIVPAPVDWPRVPPALTADFHPVPEWVHQWRQLLDKTQGDSSSVFSLWHDCLARGDFAPPDFVAAGNRFGLLEGDLPADITELAARYQALFQDVIVRWETAKANDASIGGFGTNPDEELRKILFDEQGVFAVPPTIEDRFSPEVRSGLAQLREKKSAAVAGVPVLPEAMAVRDAAPENLRVHIRGSHLALGSEVPRGLPAFFESAQAIQVSPGQSGRRELAHWLVSPRNPLTARVLVNRVWQWHFGVGLVATSDNFGLLGDRPSHPELLDWLAEQFVTSGWSIKQLHRTILLSSAYQMSSVSNAVATERDPDNYWLWRFPRRRLDAESVRDAVLAASRQMDTRMGGTLLPTANRQYVTSTANVDPVVYDSRRRSVYLPVVRSALYDVFQTFDFADPSVGQGKRETTTIATQALFMLNSQFVSEQARHMAESLLADSSIDDALRIEEAFRWCLGRSCTVTERDRVLEYVRGYAVDRAGADGDRVESRVRCWKSVCRAILSSNEFIYVD